MAEWTREMLRDGATVPLTLRCGCHFDDGARFCQSPYCRIEHVAARLSQAQATQTGKLREVFTNEVIRAIGLLARQQQVCREQDGKMIIVTGMEAAREYIVEHVALAAPALSDTTRLHEGGK